MRMDNCKYLESALAGKTIGGAVAESRRNPRRIKEAVRRLMRPSLMQRPLQRKEKAGAKVKTKAEAKAKGAQETMVMATASRRFSKQPKPHHNHYLRGKCKHPSGDACEYSHSKQLLDATNARKKVEAAAATAYPQDVGKAAAKAIAKPIADMKQQLANAGNPQADASPKKSASVKKSIAAIVAVLYGLKKEPNAIDR